MRRQNVRHRIGQVKVGFNAAHVALGWLSAEHNMMVCLDQALSTLYRLLET